MSSRRFSAAVAAVACCVILSGCSSLSQHGRSSKLSFLSHCKSDAGCDRCGDADDLCASADGCDSVCEDGCDSMGSRPLSRLSRLGQVVRGRPIAFLDRTGSVLGFANKLALWDRRADSHQVSEGTERLVADYLRKNNLNSVLVRSNQYDPVGEWQRLASNKSIAAPWRYTFGAYDWLKYTLIPGRLVGGDWYNPFTDTIHLYSDIPAIGLAKAAYAKDVHSRSLPGTYASGQDLPLVGMWHETWANVAVLDYLRSAGDQKAYADAERVLYPDFAGALGQQTLGFLPYGSVYGRAAGAVAGHAVRAIRDQSVTRIAGLGASSSLR